MKFFPLLLQIPILAIALLIALVWFGVEGLQDFRWVMVTLLHLSLLPLLYGAFVYKTKIISNADITAHQERIAPFFLVTFIYGGYLLATRLFDAPEIFKMLAVHYFLLALIVSILTIFWKVSVHTAGVTQWVVLLWIFIGSQALILSPLVILVGWLRIKIKNHDIWQVAGGIVAALASSFLAVKINFL